MSAPAYDIVIPTIGRPSLAVLLASLANTRGPLPARVIVVDDRRDTTSELELGASLGELRDRITVVASGGRGPAAARNAGRHRATAPWIAFLDDDVIAGETWREDLAHDLAACAPSDAGTQGVVSVPRAPGRRATDWERNVAGLEGAPWITADMAYRRDVLAAVGGFDERFPRAYREDSDLALRVLARGFTLVKGKRQIVHPVRPADRFVSLRLQAGNADDALMYALHGERWHEYAGADRPRIGRHALVTALGGAALLTSLGWFALTARFAWERIAPGPRTRDEIATMLLTSAGIPPLAVYHRLRGTLRARRLTRARRARAVLFDRDGTLIVDQPPPRNPDVRSMPGARDALERLRRERIRIGVVSNQHAVGEGTDDLAALRSTSERVEALLGPIEAWCYCTHARNAGCDCRKPEPGLIHRAARQLGVRPSDCVVVGDIGSDVAAARAAGARAILVPTPLTRAEEIAAAPVVAADLEDAVERILSGAV